MGAVVIDHILSEETVELIRGSQLTSWSYFWDPEPPPLPLVDICPYKYFKICMNRGYGRPLNGFAVPMSFIKHFQMLIATVTLKH